MNIKSIIGLTKNTNYNPVIAITESKGKVFLNTINTNTVFKNIGEQHIFNLLQAENLYKNFGMVTGIVDKYVDFIVGPGFTIITKNDATKKILLKFIDDVNFHVLLRAWVKEAIIKGTAYLELSSEKAKILDAKYIYIARSSTGEIEKINQIKFSSRAGNTINSNDFISFLPNEIAVLALNVIGDNVYGLGIVAPAFTMIDRLLGLQKNMDTLLTRKANAPIHAKIGNDKFQPSPDAITEFGQKLETLQGKTEFATDWLVDMKVLDFGNIAEKFTDPLKHYEDMLIFSFQVPEVILGRGNVPEGLAKAQLEVFERRIVSLQIEVENAIETQIFSRILAVHGITERVDFQWGQLSTTQQGDKIKKITFLLQNPYLDLELRKTLELEIASLLNVEVQVSKAPTNVSKPDESEGVVFNVLQKSDL